MRIKVLGLAAIGSLSLATFASPAIAGGFGHGGFGHGDYERGRCGPNVPANVAAQNCGMSVNVTPSAPAVFDPMTVHTRHPMGHLRMVQFNRAPNVSITRVHGMGPGAGLSDAPSGFTGGCFPTSTNYCRSDVGTPVSVDLAPPVNMAPPVAMPYIGTPPVTAGPVMSQPLPRLTGRSWTGQGFDPSKFQPRQYGANIFTPGIAHVPTSFVDRDPVRADMALNSGRAVAQPLANGGMAPRPGMMMSYASPAYPGPANMGSTHYGSAQSSMMMQGSAMGGMNMPPMMAQGPIMGMGGQATAPVLTANGTYASNVGADGSYWEKVSGPTAFGDTIATQVICKRKLPTKVVNPAIGVPYPVPTPLPSQCGPVAHPMHPGHGSRWTY